MKGIKRVMFVGSARLITARTSHLLNSLSSGSVHINYTVQRALKKPMTFFLRLAVTQYSHERYPGIDLQCALSKDSKK